VPAALARSELKKEGLREHVGQDESFLPAGASAILKQFSKGILHWSLAQAHRNFGRGLFSE
jgi:hypothetical protein